MFIGFVYESGEFDSTMLSEDSFKGSFQGNIVLVEVSVELFSAKYFSDLFELVVIVGTFKEGFAVENLDPKEKLPCRPS